MIWQINTVENYEYVDAEEVEVDSSGLLVALKDGEPVAGWAEGFWYSYKNVEVEVDERGEHHDVLTVPKPGNTDRPDA